jgi:hypothetical protein
MPSSLLDLPLELLDLIIANVSGLPELCRLSQSCKLLRAIAKRHLYQNIQIPPAETPEGFKACCLVLELIVSQPSIPTFVKRLDLVTRMKKDYDLRGYGWLMPPSTSRYVHSVLQAISLVDMCEEEKTKLVSDFCSLHSREVGQSYGLDPEVGLFSMLFTGLEEVKLYISHWVVSEYWECALQGALDHRKSFSRALQHIRKIHLVQRKWRRRYVLFENLLWLLRFPTLLELCIEGCAAVPGIEPDANIPDLSSLKILRLINLDMLPGILGKVLRVCKYLQTFECRQEHTEYYPSFCKHFKAMLLEGADSLSNVYVFLQAPEKSSSAYIGPFTPFMHLKHLDLQCERAFRARSFLPRTPPELPHTIQSLTLREGYKLQERQMIASLLQIAKCKIEDTPHLREVTVIDLQIEWDFRFFDPELKIKTGSWRDWRGKRSSNKGSFAPNGRCYPKGPLTNYSPVREQAEAAGICFAICYVDDSGNDARPDLDLPYDLFTGEIKEVVVKQQ